MFTTIHHLLLAPPGRYAAAVNDCSSLLALDSRYAKAYLKRGVARRKLGRSEEAEEDCSAVVRLGPANKQARAELSEIETNRCTFIRVFLS